MKIRQGNFQQMAGLTDHSISCGNWKSDSKSSSNTVKSAKADRRLESSVTSSV